MRQKSTNFAENISVMSKESYRRLCLTEASIPIFSRDWWLDTVCGSDRWNVLTVEKNGSVVAALPFYMPVKGVVTMPQYTQTMGIWFAPATADTKYSSALEERQTLSKQLIDSLKAKKFMQHFDASFTDWLPFYWNGFYQTTKYTYRLNILQNSDLLLSNMSEQARRNIRNARDGFQISVKQGISIDEFMTVQSQSFERQNITDRRSADILRRLVETTRQRGQGDLWGGYDSDGRLHAAAFVVWQSSSAYYIAGGGDPALRKSGAHSLVMWEAIKYVSQMTDVFDFEGSMLPGVERFFRQFGAIQTPYSTISKGKLSLYDKLRIKLTMKRNG